MLWCLVWTGFTPFKQPHDNFVDTVFKNVNITMEFLFSSLSFAAQLIVSLRID